ncbi:uncharacterized protein PAC_19464 [Phialocephala subalpina]|uniref:Uncharacterized protein n=1 Tax=Phialocephala subalpina TaxID=576137 RepID=A0A1L7XWZ3_9HELO|nr:uncharacterized protein PAC_19464 [Phialocephala subalpina]
MPLSFLAHTPSTAALHLALCSSSTWSDFTNNFASDIAPLLTLFGEQVTKKFLSESTSFFDNIIFGMAPMGILTAVVSAIRVYGSPSLKAIIGRAQEPHGVAGAELCSSTSRDVCEMWSEGGICRVFGRPKILEFFYKPGKKDFYPVFSEDMTEKETETPAVCNLYQLVCFLDGLGCPHRKNMSSDGPGKPSASSCDEKYGEWAEVDETSSINPPSCVEGATMEPPRSRFAPYPNLSLNIGILTTPPYLLPLVAGFATILQLSFFGFVTWVRFYQPRLYGTQGRPATWSFWICVASSNTIMFWLQPGDQRVGDQQFNAFAHHADKETYITSWKDLSDTPCFAPLTVLFSNLSAFGGLHGSVALYQIVTTLLMSVIRALLRFRRLKPKENELRDKGANIEGHELDWQATQLLRDKLKVNHSSWRIDEGDLMQDVSATNLPDDIVKSYKASENQVELIQPGNTARKFTGANISRPGCALDKITISAGKFVTADATNGPERLLYGLRLRRSPTLDSESWKSGCHAANAAVDLVFRIDRSDETHNHSKLLPLFRARLAYMTGDGIVGVQPKWESEARLVAAKLQLSIQSFANYVFSGDMPVKGKWLDVESLVWTTFCQWGSPGIAREQHPLPRNPRLSFLMFRYSREWKIDKHLLEAVTSLSVWFDKKSESASQDFRNKALLMGNSDSDNVFSTMKAWIPSGNLQRILSIFLSRLADIMEPLDIAEESRVSSTGSFMPAADTERISSARLPGLRNAHVNAMAKIFVDSGLGSDDEALMCIVPVLLGANVLPPYEDAIGLLRASARELVRTRDYPRAERILKRALNLAREHAQIRTEVLLEIGSIYRIALRRYETEEFAKAGLAQMSTFGAACSRHFDQNHNEDEKGYTKILELTKNGWPTMYEFSLPEKIITTRYGELWSFALSGKFGKGGIPQTMEEALNAIRGDKGDPESALGLVMSDFVEKRAVKAGDRWRLLCASISANCVEIIEDILRVWPRTLIKLYEDEGGSIAPLSLALRENCDIRVIKTILEFEGPDLDVDDDTHRTALQHAIVLQRFDAIELLLANGADVNKSSGIGWTAVFYSISSEDSNPTTQEDTQRILPLLMSKGARLDATIDGNLTLFQKAIRVKNATAVRILYNTKANQPMMTLHDILRNKETDIVLGFLAASRTRTDLDEVDNSMHDVECKGGQIFKDLGLWPVQSAAGTPLHVAIDNEQADVVNKILKASTGAINMKIEGMLGCALVLACFKGNYAIVKTLCDNATPPLSAAGPIGSAIAVAVAGACGDVARGDVVILSALTGKFGLSPNDGQIELGPPLVLACTMGNYAVTEFLLQREADPNVKGKNGMTPLLSVILGTSQDPEKNPRKDDLKIIKLLLRGVQIQRGQAPTIRRLLRPVIKYVR